MIVSYRNDEGNMVFMVATEIVVDDNPGFEIHEDSDPRFFSRPVLVSRHESHTTKEAEDSIAGDLHETNGGYCDISSFQEPKPEQEVMPG